MWTERTCIFADEEDIRNILESGIEIKTTAVIR